MTRSTIEAPTTASRHLAIPARRPGRSSTRRTMAVLVTGTVLLAACSGSGTTPGSSAAAAAATAAVPSGAPGNAPPGGSATSATVTGTAAYTQSGGTASKSGEEYTAVTADESAIMVTDSGSLSLTNATVTTSGDTSSADSSSFYGLNAGVLATSGSSITMTGGTITTTGAGANGAFATGSGSSVSLSGVTISATGGGGHGVMATQGASVTLDDVAVTTAGANSAPIATDRGGGTITVTGGTLAASGQDSPGLYSTGTLVVSGATISATGAESAVIEGSNSITLTNTSLTSSKADKWGVMIYQSMSGDASGGHGTFTMTGGSLSNTAATGPLFYVTNSTGTITLKGVAVTAASGILVKAAAGSWGTDGSNGGTAILVADAQELAGDLVAEQGSSLSATLGNGSSLTGAITNGALTLDATSTWTVTGDSTLTSLADAAGVNGETIANIVGNGHTVTYDASLAANSSLGGRTYTLAGGGILTPA